MKKILIHAKGAVNNNIFDPNERDNWNEPMIYLKDRLSSMGYELRTSDDCSLDDCERILFFDSSSVHFYLGVKGKIRWIRDFLKNGRVFRNLYAECLKTGIAEKTALFLWEGPVTDPNNWDCNLHKMFPIIFTWNDSYVDGEKYHKIYCPQIRSYPDIPVVPFEKKKLLINISMNKKSNHPRELYSVRCKSIKYFERKRPTEFDLFGVGWNKKTNIVGFRNEKYSSYRGVVKNKWNVLPYYRFSLCYENISGEYGCVSEKIFDCMRAACVPIYLGASNISDYVDKEAFIDRREFDSDKDLEEFLLSIDEKKYAQYIEAMNSYLKSDKFKKFSPNSFADIIINTLKLKKDHG